jgi:hypothetical protein
VLAATSDLKRIHSNSCSRDWIRLKVPTSELNSGHQGNSTGSYSTVIQLGMGLDVLGGLQSRLIELSRKIQASNTDKDDIRGYALTPRHMRSNWISRCTRSLADSGNTAVRRRASTSGPRRALRMKSISSLSELRMPQQASNKESVYETTMDIPDIMSSHAYDLTLASRTSTQNQKPCKLTCELGLHVRMPEACKTAHTVTPWPTWTPQVQAPSTRRDCLNKKSTREAHVKLDGCTIRTSSATTMTTTL